MKPQELNYQENNVKLDNGSKLLDPFDVAMPEPASIIAVEISVEAVHSIVILRKLLSSSSFCVPHS